MNLEKFTQNFVLRRLLFAFLLSMSYMSVNAQASAANYIFSADATGSLALDKDGNALDMSTGTTTLIGSGLDATASSITNIGFDFYFMGNRFTQFGVQDDGILQFGTVPSTNVYTITGGTLAAPRLAAFNADFRTGLTTGKVHYKLFGTAPNRVAVVEFFNMQLFYTGTAATGTSTWQMRFYETSGVIEYVYGTMNASDITSSNKAPSIGFYTGAATNSFASVTYNTHSNSVTSPYAANPAVSATGDISNLNSTSDGNRRYYRFTPNVLSNPNPVTATSVMGSSMNLNWVDAAGEQGYAIYRSIDNVNFNFVTSVAANTVTYAATGLSFGTTYYWRVGTIADGGLSMSSTLTQATIASTFSGVKTIGTGGDYQNLTQAFTAMNTNGLNGNVFLELIAGYPVVAEPAQLVVPDSVVTGTFTTRIYPRVTGLSISGSFTTGLLNFNRSKNFVIDGRVDTTGTVKDLIINNTNTTAGAYAVQFINESSNNTIKYSILRATNPSASSGVVVFSTTTGVNGNDNNTITNCDIDGRAAANASPTASANHASANGIYCSGTGTSGAVANNSGIIITNCNIYDWFLTGAAITSAGIQVAAGGSAWTISNNSFYQTNTRTSTVGIATVRGIQIQVGNGYTISSNFIGGNATTAGGSAFTLNGLFANVFQGMNIATGTTASTSISSNTITNINFSSTLTGTTIPGSFAGIYMTGASVNVNGNTIGATTGTGSIVIHSTASSATSCAALGIGFASTTRGTITNNNIGSITLSASSATPAHTFRGIWISSGSSAVVLDITGNLIGSTTTANSIQATHSTTSAAVEITGILSASTAPTLNISSNTIANLRITSGSNSTSCMIRGIVASANTQHTITNNTIRDFNSSSVNVGTGTSSSVQGIQLSMSSTTSNQTVTGNTIHSLKNSNTTAGVTVSGIVATWSISGNPTLLVSANNIHSLSTTGLASSNVQGILISNGTATYSNNMIRMGYDESGAATTLGQTIYGIREAGGTNTILHNTLYTGGTGVGGTNNTYAFFASNTSSTRVIRNNLFVNDRQNGVGTGFHLAAEFAGGPGFSGLTLNNNIYFSATSTTLIRSTANTTNYTLNGWRTYSAKDAASGVASAFADIGFANATGNAASVNLHITAASSVIESAGTNLASITTDFDGETRNSLTPVDVGADAGNFVAIDIIAPDISFVSITNTTSTSNRTLTDFAIITDGASGVNTTTNKPRLYFRRKTDADTYNDNTSGTDGWKYVEASDVTSPFDFTLDYSLLNGGTGVAVGDSIRYFVVAQDNNSTPNVGIFNGGFSNWPTSVSLGMSQFPLTGTILSYTINSAFVWNGTTSDFQLATNWTPNRNTISASDVLIFDGMVTSTTTVDNIPSQTVNKVVFQNNINATLNAAIANNLLTISTSTSDSALIIRTGSTVNLGTTTTLLLAHGAAAGQLSAIRGTLHLRNAATFNPAFSITTVTGTIINSSSVSTAFPSASSSNFLFTTGTYEHQKNGGAMPSASYQSTSTINVTGITTTEPTPPSACGNFVWNSPSQTGTALSLLSTLTSISGNVNIESTGIGSMQFGTSTPPTVAGVFTVNGGNLVAAGGTFVLNGGLVLNGGIISNSGATTFNIKGNVSQAAASTITATSGITFGYVDAVSQTVSFAGTNSGTFNHTVNNAMGVVMNSNVTVLGALTLTNGYLNINGNTLNLNGTTSATSGFIRGGLTSTLNIGGTGALGTLNFDQTTDGTTNVLNNFTINRTTSGTVTLGNKLVVLGVLTPTDGTLTTAGFLHLRSDASNTARVGVVGATASVSGNVTVERYLPQRRAWRLLTAPITQSTLSSLNATWKTLVDIVGPSGSNLTQTRPGYNFLTFNASTNAWTNVSDPTAVNLTGTSLNNAFCAFIPGPINTPITDSANVTLTSTGSLLTGSKTFNITASADNYALIPNPYASPVDLNAVYSASSNIYRTFYTWDPRQGGSIGTGGYITISWNGFGYNIIGNGNATAQDSSLQSGQAFFVQASSANPSVVFNESAKVTNTLNTVFGAGTSKVDDLRIGLQNIQSGTPKLIGEVLSSFHNNYSKQVNFNDDADKMWNNEENIALKRGNYNLSIERRPFITGDDSIFIGLSSLRSNTNYALEFKPSNWDAGSKAYLIDKLLSTETLIDLNAASFTHQFTSTVATANDRFVVVFRGATLPNKNFIVGAEKLGTNKVKVNWEAQGEIGVKEYSLEKSVDGVNYQSINTQVAKNGNSNSKYTFTDNSPVNGVNYYRVKTTQQNDIERYSSVVTVNFKQNNTTPLTVYPNPVRGNQIGLQLQEVEQGMYSIRLLSVDGREVYKQQLQVGSSRGLNTTISPQTKLSTGTYTLQVVGKNQSYTQKVVVE
jgi:hypothetical protein